MDDWQIDVASQTATHSSGLQLSFEGKPRTKHFSGTPTHVPDGMQSLQLVRLIREGYQAFENAWPDEGEGDSSVAKKRPAGPSRKREVASRCATGGPGGAFPVLIPETLPG